MGLQIKKGTCRSVILIGPYAIKIARFWHSNSGYRWKSFLRGILSNIDEVYWYKHSHQKDKLCPVLFRLPLSVVIIMKRAESLSIEEYNKEAFANEFKALTLDNKIQNFGKLDGKIVLVDYGDSPFMCEDCDFIFKHR